MLRITFSERKRTDYNNRHLKYTQLTEKKLLQIRTCGISNFQTFELFNLIDGFLINVFQQNQPSVTYVITLRCAKDVKCEENIYSTLTHCDI